VTAADASTIMGASLMTIRHSFPVAVTVGAALLLVVSGCSSEDSAEPFGRSAGSDKPATTTVDLSLNGEAVDLSGAAQKCYDHEGHLMVEAYNADEPESSHFLMDDYQGKVALSIGVRGGESGVFEYEPDKDGQSAKVTRDGDSVSATGTIGVAQDDTADPQEFKITARCAKFVDTPPDSSKVDPSDVPSIPSTCPAGEAVCIPGGN
jgi:lipoprotein antigen